MKKSRGYMTSLMAESGAQIISAGHFFQLLCPCLLLGWFYSEIGKYGHKQFQVFILPDLRQIWGGGRGRVSLSYIKWFTHLKFTHLYKPMVLGYIQRVIQPSSQFGTFSSSPNKILYPLEGIPHFPTTPTPECQTITNLLFVSTALTIVDISYKYVVLGTCLLSLSMQHELVFYSSSLTNTSLYGCTFPLSIH